MVDLHGWMLYLGESKDVASGCMIDFVDLDACFADFERVDHEGDAMHKVRFGGYLLVVALLNEFIKPLLLGARNDIPNFTGALVIVVERVDVEVLDVPAEGGEFHPKVYPWDSDSANLLIAD